MGVQIPVQLKYYLCIFFIAALIYFPGTSRPLRDAEAKYAEIPREMLELGAWLTPQFDYTRYYVKPPLTFWTTALLYKGFGVTERNARLANIFWAFLAALFTGLLAEKIFGGTTGPLSTALFLLTAGVYTYCLDAGIEFGLITLIVLALISFWQFYQSGSLMSRCLFYLAMGVGYMAKGLVAIVIPAGAAFLFLLLQKDGKRIRGLLNPQAMTILLIVSAPWTILMIQEHPDFLKVFFVNEHLHRFTGTMDSNDSLFPTSLFLALVAGSFFPWTLYLPLMGVSLSKMIGKKEIPFHKVLFLLAWAVVPLVLFSVSRSKVDFYGLHSFPPLIVLLSPCVRDVLATRRFVASRSWSYPWFLVAFLAFVSLALLLSPQGRHAVRAFDIPSPHVALFFLFTALILGISIALSFLKEKVHWAFFGMFLFVVSLFFSTKSMFVADFPNDSMKFAADSFVAEAKPGALLISEEPPEFEHVASLNYYTGEPVLLLRDREGSILTFIQKDREALCLDEEDLKSLIYQRRTIYLVGKTEETQKRLFRLSVPFISISSSGKQSLFRLGLPCNADELAGKGQPLKENRASGYDLNYAKTNAFRRGSNSR